MLDNLPFIQKITLTMDFFKNIMAFRECPRRTHDSLKVLRNRNEP